jgi:hypothetical protein
MRPNLADFAHITTWIPKQMHFPDLPALSVHNKRSQTHGPIALVLVEDTVEVDSTIAHLRGLGFGQIIIFCAPDMALPDPGNDDWDRVDFDVTQDDAVAQITNTMIDAQPQAWLYYCYNAEYLYYPFCEDRNLREMLGFMHEERRKSVMSYVVDLYAADLGTHPAGVDRDTACFDKTGYYALSRVDDAGAPLERQFDISGGLRWRYEEHIPKDRRRNDRVSLFQAQAGLKMLPDRSFNMPEYNTVSCPWHNNLTAAIPSFRTAKALRRNPGSRDQISNFHWPQSVRFDWTSQQLLDLGMMEPGQWF